MEAGLPLNKTTSYEGHMLRTTIHEDSKVIAHLATDLIDPGHA